MADPPLILVVDDEQSYRDALSVALQREGFLVETAADGPEAIERFDATRPALVLLDVMLPKISGIDVCRELRARSRVPIIMVTARNAEIDAVVGLEVGADDYVTKPFRMRELVARIRAVVRRTESQTRGESLLRGGDVTLDPIQHEVTVRGESISLTRVEFDLLRRLMSAPGRVLTRAHLADQLAEEGGFTGLERTLNVHVRNLRAKVERDPANPEHVETVFGIGYRFRRFE